MAYDPTTPQVWAVVNSGSYSAGKVSPGGVITIYGAGLGPAGITAFSGASLPLSLGVAGANTSVTIDGKPAPMLYTSPTQINCVVPFAVTPALASSLIVDLYVKYNGVTSTKPFKVNVVAADPGVFTLDPSGQAAILNIDTSVTPFNYSVNGAKDLASAGSWVAIYATGFGLTACVNAVKNCDSSAATTADQFVSGGTVTPQGAVTVKIGGQDVISAVGVVPVGSIRGLLQINAQLPASVLAGTAVPVVISIGGVASTGNATLAVK